MANFTANFLVYAVVAIFAENAIFSRALGLDRALALVDDMGNMVTFGALTTIYLPGQLSAAKLPKRLCVAAVYLYFMHGGRIFCHICGVGQN